MLDTAMFSWIETLTTKKRLSPLLTGWDQVSEDAPEDEELVELVASMEIAAWPVKGRRKAAKTRGKRAPATS
jgi:hypothetical protein